MRNLDIDMQIMSIVNSIPREFKILCLYMEMYVVRCELENLHVDQNTVWGANIFVTMRNMTDIPIERIMS